MYHVGYGFGFGGLLWVLLCVVGVVIVVAALVSLFRGRGGSDHASQWTPPSAPPAPTYPAAPTMPASPLRPEPLEILRERFARGDITAEEFEAAKRVLGY